MRVLLVGASGHVGCQVADAIRRVPGLSLCESSRRPGPGRIELDLAERSTFSNADGFDWVVNASDSLRADPLPFYRRSVRRGQRSIELSADAATCDRLLECLTESALTKASGGEPHAEASNVGTVLVGAGVFPGLSQMLALSAWSHSPSAQSVELFLSWSLWSGAGSGTCRLMVDALVSPRIWLEQGERRTGSPLGEIVTHPWGRPRFAIEAGFPESILLQRSAHSDSRPLTARTSIAVRPGLPRWALAVTRSLCRRRFFATRPMRAALGFGFNGVRARLLGSWKTGSRKTAASIGVVAGSRTERLEVSDAMAATGHMVASSLAALRRERILPAGAAPIESVVSLESLLGCWESLQFPALKRSIRD